MNEGLQKSIDSGVHRWDYLLLMMGVLASLLSGDVHTSRELLGKMSLALEYGRPLDKFYYYWLASWHSMLDNDIQGAISLSSTALELVTKVNVLGGEARCRLLQAHYMHLAGRYGEAKDHIEKSRAIGQRMKGYIIIFYSDLKAASIAFTESDEEAGLKYLRDAMSLGRENGYAAFDFIILQQEELAYMCVKALEAGIEPHFVTEMIRKRNGR
jgi:hypothetical protein